MKRLALTAVLAGCHSFPDPNVVVDLRVLAMSADQPLQLVDVDLMDPQQPAQLLQQLTDTRVCALVADPVFDRKLRYELTLCTYSSDGRCGDIQATLASGILDDPDTTVPEPQLCATVSPNANLLGVLLDALHYDVLGGLGGLDYMVVLRIGGEDGDRDLDLYAAKTLKVVPRIPMERSTNANPSVDAIDATILEAPPAPIALGRCVDNPPTTSVRPRTQIRLTPVESAGARETYVVPTLDGNTRTFTESLTYQWVASAGGYSAGDTGGPRDISGNPQPLFSDWRAPAAEDLDGPTDISLWIIQRDERLGVRWYESCIRVEP